MDKVRLGYPLGGAAAAPILLQPREPRSQIVIGESTVIVNGCEFIARESICVGDHCRIGARTVIMDSDFHGIKPSERNQPGVTLPVVIESNVWLGSEVMVLKGVHIGRDAVVGARAVVAKDVPAGAIVAGNPVRVIGSVYA